MKERTQQEWTVEFAKAMGWTEWTPPDTQPNNWYFVDVSTSKLFAQATDGRCFNPFENPADALELADAVFIHREHDSHTLKSGGRIYSFIGYVGTAEDEKPKPFGATGYSDCEAITNAVTRYKKSQATVGGEGESPE